MPEPNDPLSQRLTERLAIAGSAATQAARRVMRNRRRVAVEATEPPVSLEDAHEALTADLETLIDAGHAVGDPDLGADVDAAAREGAARWRAHARGEPCPSPCHVCTYRRAEIAAASVDAAR